MEYMTRHLIAIRELRHEGQHLQPGDKFEASDVDANYYLMTGLAHVPQSGHAPAPAPVAGADAADAVPKRRGRPPNSARVAVEAPVAAEPAAAEEPAAEEQATQAADSAEPDQAAS